jgi:aminoglycoside phosphotransferase (APT) family kinase protein
VDGRMVMLDVDRVCVGDPAIDVGHFMAACTARRWKERASPPATSPRRFSMRILSGVRIGLETRSRLFQAASLVRMAVRSLTQRPDLYRDGSDESVPVRLLDEATACLAAPRRV